MKRILITGSNGLLGRELVNNLAGLGHEVIGISKGVCRSAPANSSTFRYYDVDITDDLAVEKLMQEERPHTVVHAAAMTQVDECEQQGARCEAVNVKATAQLLVSAEQWSRHFIFISTDFVFDGEKGNYAEDDDLNPVSWYGFTKVQAEGIVSTSEIPFAIIRTCLVYGATEKGMRNNIVMWVKQSLEDGKQIQVVSDQWRTPTYVKDLARGIALVIEKNATGTFHISGSEGMTPYDIALQTAASCGLDAALIEKTDANRFSQPAKRPPKTGFDISKARNVLGYVPTPFKDALREIFR